MAQFADHGGDGAAAQRLLHRPQQVAGSRGGHRQQALGEKSEGIETGPVGRAAFGERHVLGDPDEILSFTSPRLRGEVARRSEAKAGG